MQTITTFSRIKETDYSIYFYIGHDIYHDPNIHFKCISHFAQQGYENPRKVTECIVCANCHLANKLVDIDVPQAVLPNTVLKYLVEFLMISK